MFVVFDEESSLCPLSSIYAAPSSDRAARFTCERPPACRVETSHALLDWPLYNACAFTKRALRECPSFEGGHPSAGVCETDRRGLAELRRIFSPRPAIRAPARRWRAPSAPSPLIPRVQVPHCLVISGAEGGFFSVFPFRFVRLIVVDPYASVQLPTMLCISERRVRGERGSCRATVFTVAPPSVCLFCMCARAFMRSLKTASFVVVHKDKKWPRTQCKT